MTREEIRALDNTELDSKLFEISGPKKQEGYEASIYVNDLNALQAAEAMLTPEQYVKYLINVRPIRVHNSKEKAINEKWGHWSKSSAYYRGISDALVITPRQQAEALLEVLTEEVDFK